MLNDDTSISGILEIGTWTATSVTAGGTATKVHNEDNVYTHTKIGRPAADGARLVPSLNKVQQRAGDSGGVVDSQVTEHDWRLEFSLLGAVLNKLRIMLGLPSTALTGDLAAGTPTTETLVVRGREIASQKFQFYVKTRGPLGPRYYYFPLCDVGSLNEINMNKNQHLEPGAGWDVYENSAGEYFWFRDLAA